MGYLAGGMAGSAPTARRHIVRQGRSRQNQRTLRDELKASSFAQLSGEALPVDPAEAAGIVMGRTAEMLQFVMGQVDNLIPDEPSLTSADTDHMWIVGMDGQGNAVFKPHFAMVLEQELRKELFDMATKAQAVGLASRRVQIQEAQMAIMGRALGEAAEQAGLTEKQKTALASGLRDSLLELQKGVVLDVDA